MLLDMKKAQAVFDNPEVEKKFGPIIVDYKTIQYQVNQKYFGFRRETFHNLQNRLRDLLVKLYKDAQDGKDELEKTSFSGATIAKLLDSVKKLKVLRERSADWEENWTEYEQAESLIKHNRY